MANWRNIKQIENISNYIDSFNIHNFIETIKIKPEAWYQGRPGKDDWWGVKLVYAQDFNPDAYFVINKLIFHDKLDQTLWYDSAYTSGYNEKNKIEQSGMYKEWGIAKKTQGEIQQKVYTEYSKHNHFKLLENINKLQSNSVFTLNDIWPLINNIEYINILTQEKTVNIPPHNSTSNNKPLECIIDLLQNEIITPKTIRVFYQNEYNKKTDTTYTIAEVLSFIRADNWSFLD